MKGVHIRGRARGPEASREGRSRFRFVIRLAAQEPGALEVLPEELPPGPAGEGGAAAGGAWLATFDSGAAAPAAEGAGEEEEAAWQHVASLCAFLPRGEQPLLRMFDGEALLRGVAVPKRYMLEPLGALQVPRTPRLPLNHPRTHPPKVPHGRPRPPSAQQVLR